MAKSPNIKVCDSKCQTWRVLG